MEYAKVKSPPKIIKVRGRELSKTILDTMKTISDIVGATLGPGGMPVLIERQDHDMPPMVTKDGVTVFRSLGFLDPIAHCAMESARDCAVRTVMEAGDGTTTATILGEAITRWTETFVDRNPHISSQKIVRRLESLFKTVIEPSIKGLAITKEKIWESVIDTDNPQKDAQERNDKTRALLRNIAAVSANGDDDLADKVMECFDLVGDQGNVTIAEINGPSSYQVERIEGYHVPIGYEESCTKFMTKFINDPGRSRAFLENAKFLLHFGQITNEHQIFGVISRLAQEFQEKGEIPHLVVVATGFSDSVIAFMAMNFDQPGAIKILPLLAPRSPVMNGEFHFLEDLSAITGAAVLDPINHPLEKFEMEDLGRADAVEMYRFRSCIIGHNDPDEVMDRATVLEAQLAVAESRLDRALLQERIGALTGGIARLKVIGASNAELKEKRDRAEDAVCAVKGAIKHGALPGGGWTLLKLVDILGRITVDGKPDPVIQEVLLPALAEPVARLFLNLGMTEREAEELIGRIQEGIVRNEFTVYDGMKGEFVDALESGLLDSTPAVLEAIRNSISMASLMGTLGGVVVQGRDRQLEREEAGAAEDFWRNAHINEANERA